MITVMYSDGYWCVMDNGVCVYRSQDCAAANRFARYWRAKAKHSYANSIHLR